jgi:hypothetical protein
MQALQFQDQRRAQGMQEKLNQLSLDQADAEKKKTEFFNHSIKSNMIMNPKGEMELDKKSFLSDLYNHPNMAKEAMKYDSQFSEEKRKELSNNMANHQVKFKVLADIHKSLHPTLKGVEDTKLRSSLLKDEYKKIGLNPDLVPDNVTNDYLQQQNQKYADKGQFLKTTDGIQFGNLRTGEVRPIPGREGKPLMPAFAPKLVETSRGQQFVQPGTGEQVGGGFGQKPSTEIAQGKLELDRLKQELETDKRKTATREKKAQSFANLSSSHSGYDRVIDNVNKILSSKSLDRITGLQGKIADWPGSDAAVLRSQLKSLKSKVGFAVLQNMRDMSKTGGALGSIAVAELEMLQNNLSNLESSEQSEPELRDNLQIILDFAEGSKSRLTDAYKSTFPDTNQSPNKPLGKKSKVSKSDQDLLNKYGVVD